MILLVAALIALVLGLTVVAVVGSMLPTAVSAAAAVRISGDPVRVIDALTDVVRLPSWQPGTRAVGLGAGGGWFETGHRGTVHVRREAVDPGSTERAEALALFRDRVERDGAHAGTRHIAVSADGPDTLLTVRVERTVKSAFGRFHARYIAAHGADEKAWLEALARHLGEHTVAEVMGGQGR